MSRSPRSTGIRKPPSLQRFTLEELAPFTKEGVFASNASQDFHLFYVGRDDVHGILKYLLSRTSTSLYLNMFGYDDEALNAECMRCAMNRSITTVITLDKSQSGGKHEKAILDSGMAKNRTLHSSRHTFITMCRRGGARKDVLEKVTHNAKGDIVDAYTHWDWNPLCEAVLCLQLGSQTREERMRVKAQNGDATGDAYSQVYDITVEAPGIEPGSENALLLPLRA
jgi:hypothetical protein